MGTKRKHKSADDDKMQADCLKKGDPRSWTSETGNELQTARPTRAGVSDEVAQDFQVISKGNVNIDGPQVNLQKPKTKIKMRNQKKYKEISRMSCLIGYRNSERVWLMKVLQRSLGETQSKGVKTLPSHHMNFQWSREQTWNRVRVSTMYTRTFRRPQTVILLENKK